MNVTAAAVEEFAGAKTCTNKSIEFQLREQKVHRHTSMMVVLATRLQSSKRLS